MPDFSAASDPSGQGLAPPLPQDARDWALFLDVDGTLLEIAPTPHDVVVPPTAGPLLDRLFHTLGGAVALVSGRPIRELDRLFAPLRPAAAGLHGLERRSAEGTLHQSPRQSEDLTVVRTALEDFAERHPGVLIEDKGATIALHYRQAPDSAAAAQLLIDNLVSGLAGQFHVQSGKMVLEIKPDSAHKGTVVESFLSERPFSGRLPLYLGDDVTDEDAFNVVNQLGGYSVRVGEPGPTAARWRLESVTAVHHWLGKIADHLDRLTNQ